jgi:hypothetical protein
MVLDTTKEIIESSNEIETELLKSIERENELALIQKNINSLTEERANLLETVATLEKSIQATEPFKEDLPEQYASYVSLLDKTKEQLAETETGLNNWQRQLSLANGYTEDILNAIELQSTKQNELNALVEKQATLTKNIAEFDETFGEDASKFKTYSELNTELSETNNKISTLEKDLSGLTSKISSFTSANKTMLDEFDKSIFDRELSFISFDFEGAIQKDMESIKAAASTAGKALSEELTNSINEELTTQEQKNIFNGGALVDSFVSGMDSKAGEVKEATYRNFLEPLDANLGFGSDPDEGPLSKTTYNGQMLVSNFALGMNESAPILFNTMTVIFTQATNIMKDIVHTAVEATIQDVNRAIAALRSLEAKRDSVGSSRSTTVNNANRVTVNASSSLGLDRVMRSVNAAVPTR